LELTYVKKNPQINFLIQKHLYRDNPTWTINYLE